MNFRSNIELVILLNLMNLVYPVWTTFRWENDVTKLATNFAFSIMVYIMTVSERPSYKDLKTKKN